MGENRRDGNSALDGTIPTARGSWVGNLTIAAPTFTQVQVYTSPNVMSELTDNYSNGNTYAGYYATGTTGDPLTQTITDFA